MTYVAVPAGGECTRLPLAEASKFTGTPSEQKDAKHWCNHCPVRQRCLEVALELPDHMTVKSVWGGFTSSQRIAIRQRGLNPDELASAEPPEATSTQRRARSKISKYVGVHLMSGSKWRASIHVDGRKIYLGTFPLTDEGEEQAARAYDRAAWLHRGPAAKLNFSRAEAAGYGSDEVATGRPGEAVHGRGQG